MADRLEVNDERAGANIFPGWAWIISGLFILAGIYLSSFYSYLLFHSLAELFSIAIAFSIFVVAWNCRGYLDNNYLLVLGIAYLFVAIVDTLHTLAYNGMGVFTGYDANLPTQLWILARYLESSSLLVGPFFLGRKLNVHSTLAAYSAVVVLGLGSIFYWEVFPECFIEGRGLSPFKKTSGYLICLILFGSLALLVRMRALFEKDVWICLVLSILATVAAELFFTFYVSVYGLSNLMGHIFKIASFYLIYKAIIHTGLTRPHALLWRELKPSEQRWRQERDRAQGYLDVAGIIILALGLDHKVNLINRMGCKILGLEAQDILGKDWFEGFVPESARGKAMDFFYKLISTGDTSLHFFEDPILDKKKEERIIAWRASFLKDADGHIQEVLYSGEDITERKRAEQEREKLIKDLQDAISQVKVLIGMLPICASCKKIRDDKGYWTQIEAYIREHSEMEFTHGICPECKRNLYPEYAQD